MDEQLEQRYAIDILAAEAGGYCALPTEQETAYTNLLFDVCRQFGIRYYTATPKERFFVEEVTRVTWEREQEAKTGLSRSFRPAFSA